MSVWEASPVDDADWDELSETERDEWLRETFEGFAPHWKEAASHDQAGYYADFAGSQKCAELGHTEDDMEDEETHPPGWDGDPLCEATRHGSCCTVCEGECAFEMVPSLWSLPGVTA